MNNGKHGDGTPCTKMGADSSTENTPKFICPICVPKPKSLGFQWASIVRVYTLLCFPSSFFSTLIKQPLATKLKNKENGDRNWSLWKHSGVKTFLKELLCNCIFMRYSYVWKIDSMLRKVKDISWKKPGFRKLDLDWKSWAIANIKINLI